MARSVNKGVHDIVHFDKLAEGGFNRVFQAFMSDGSQLIARIPYPSTTPRHLAVASEVATMDFLRRHGLPIPKVHEYSTRVENAVGTEYIVMDVAEGRKLGDDWFLLSDEARVKIIFQIAQLEDKLFSIRLPAYGSIFYAHDLEASSPSVHLPDPQGTQKFCVGPSTSQNLWHHERTLLDIARGPCKCEWFAITMNSC